MKNVMTHKKPEPLPKLRLTLNIGVIGHRPERLQNIELNILRA